MFMSVWQMKDRTIVLQTGTSLSFLRPNEAEWLKNVLEKADSSP